MVTVTQFQNNVAKAVQAIIDKDISNLGSIVANTPFAVLQTYAEKAGVSVSEMETAIAASYTPFGTETFPAIVGSQFAAATDMLQTDIRPKLKNSIFRVTCILTVTAAKLQIMIKGGGSQTAIKGILNNNATLTADNLFVFDIPVHSGFKYNFQVDTKTTVNLLTVMEITP